MGVLKNLNTTSTHIDRGMYEEEEKALLSRNERRRNEKKVIGYKVIHVALIRTNKKCVCDGKYR